MSKHKDHLVKIIIDRLKSECPSTPNGYIIETLKMILREEL